MYYAYHFGYLHEFTEYSTPKADGWITYKKQGGSTVGNYIKFVSNSPEEAFDKYDKYLDERIQRAEENLKHANECLTTWKKNKERHKAV